MNLALWAFFSGLTIGLYWPIIRKRSKPWHRQLVIASMVALAWPLMALLLAVDCYADHLRRIEGRPPYE